VSDRTIRGIAWTVAGLSAVMAVAAIALGYSTRSNIVLEGFGLATALIGVLFPICGAVILTRRPRNVIGALFCCIGFFQALEPFSGVYAIQALISRPGSLPFGAEMAWLSVWTWAPGLGVALTFLFLLYPDGHLPSRRWRPLAWLSAAAIVLIALPLAAATWSTRGTIDLANNNNLPLRGFDEIADNVSSIATIAAIPIAALCVASLWVRLRHASGDLREQIKWFAYAAVIVVAGIVADAVLTGGSPLSAVIVPIIPAATAIAILKYHLYDIDVVISRTLVYGSLALLITAVYVGIAVGIGAAIGSGGKPNLALSIVATGIVAVGFQPARERLQTLTNRLVYGRRATPYEVLSQFSSRVAVSYASDDVLPRMARVLAEGTNADIAEVWLGDENGQHCAARFQVESSAAVPPTDRHDRSVMVRHHGDVLGALTVTKRRGESLTPIEIKLMDDLANQAGLVLKNVGLSADLRARLDDLRASRQRLVAAQDDERRRLERNLHDGAQQHLVAIKVKIGLVEMLTSNDPVRARATIAALKSDADDALETLRDLARGIYPPLLADQGLPAALRSQATKATLPVRVAVDGVGRYTQETEAALYFCSLEALQNVQKYAAASVVDVHISDNGEQLEVVISDDGRGFDVASTRRGSGLTNMEDRLDAIGGRLEIVSTPGSGTRVRVLIPSCQPATA
jgi:signal transduction histidine kinase